MNDLADLNADWLAIYVRQTRNFAPLADWLRLTSAIGEPLRLVLADIVEGNLKPSGKRKSRTDGALPGLLKMEIKFWKHEFLLHADNPTAIRRGGKIAFDWQELEPILKSAGYSGTPYKDGECGTAAKKIVCWLNGLSPYELEKVLRRKVLRAETVLAARTKEERS